MLEELLGRVAGRFGRVEPRRRLRGFLLGLLGDLPRKNCWTIAEHAGEASPEGMQHLLARACWDTDGVRDDLRDFVVDHLGDAEAVLVFDETGDVKKGTATVGAQRQYTGTAGRVENAQVAVYLTYAGGSGHAMIDRSCTCRGPGPTTRTVAPRREYPRTWSSRPSPHWPGPCSLVRWMPGCRRGGWPAMRSTGPTPGCALSCRPGGWGMCWSLAAIAGCPPRRARAAPRRWPPACPEAPALGRPGRQGAALLPLGLDRADRPGRAPLAADPPPPRRGELAFYRCYSPAPVRLGELVRVAGRRWAIQESFQTGKGLAGLDEHQLRRWLPWRRWTLLAMLAHALLVVIAATERAQRSPPDGLIALTCNEIRHLFTRLITEPTRRLTDPLAWSHWRRRHQHQARLGHYRRQEAQLA